MICQMNGSGGADRMCRPTSNSRDINNHATDFKEFSIPFVEIGILYVVRSIPHALAMCFAAHLVGWTTR